MGQLPSFLSKLDPIVQKLADYLITIQTWSGFSWPIIIAIICVFLRISFLPLFVLQIKKLSKLAFRFNLMKEVRKLGISSNLTNFRSKVLILKFYRKSIKHEKLEPLKFIGYNLIHIPVLILTIFGLRRALACEKIKAIPFLWIKDSFASDPYYILPFLTCAVLYYNFGKGITPLTRDLMIGRIRLLCQKLMILWFVFLAHWPGSITFYIFCNAVFSLVQTSIVSNPIFLSMINRQYLLSMMLFSKEMTQNNERAKEINKIFKTESAKKVLEEQVIENCFYDLGQISSRIK